jgi:hypothetical protein
VNESAPQSPSVFGTLARRAVAWLIVVAVALVLLKIVVGIVIGLAHAVLFIALLAVLGVAALWAFRHL